MRKLKTINYLLRLEFDIPESWLCFFDQDEGGMYFEDREDSGTLRLSELVFEVNDLNPTSIAADEKAKGAIELSNGSWLRLDRKQFFEDGENCTSFYWTISNDQIRPYIQIAIFSFCVCDKDLEKPHIKEDLELLNTELRRVRFLQF